MRWLIKSGPVSHIREGSPGHFFLERFRQSEGELIAVLARRQSLLKGLPGAIVEDYDFQTRSVRRVASCFLQVRNCKFIETKAPTLP